MCINCFFFFLVLKVFILFFNFSSCWYCWCCYVFAEWSVFNDYWSTNSYWWWLYNPVKTCLPFQKFVCYILFMLFYIKSHLYDMFIKIYFVLNLHFFENFDLFWIKTTNLMCLMLALISKNWSLGDHEIQLINFLFI